MYAISLWLLSEEAKSTHQRRSDRLSAPAGRRDAARAFPCCRRRATSVESLRNRHGRSFFPRVRARRFLPSHLLEKIREPRPLHHEADGDGVIARRAGGGRPVQAAQRFG